MGLFSHAKQKDKLIKYLKEKRISVAEVNGKLEVEFAFPGYGISLFPYFIINDDENYFSMIVNIKKVSDKKNIELYDKINNFNLSSQYFTLKLSQDNVLFLEYNTIIDDNIKEIFDLMSDSLNELIDVINNL